MIGSVYISIAGEALAGSDSVVNVFHTGMSIHMPK